MSEQRAVTVIAAVAQRGGLPTTRLTTPIAQRTIRSDHLQVHSGDPSHVTPAASVGEVFSEVTRPILRSRQKRATGKGDSPPRFNAWPCAAVHPHLHLQPVNLARTCGFIHAFRQAAGRAGAAGVVSGARIDAASAPSARSPFRFGDPGELCPVALARGFFARTLFLI